MKKRTIKVIAEAGGYQDTRCLICGGPIRRIVSGTRDICNKCIHAAVEKVNNQSNIKKANAHLLKAWQLLQKGNK